MGLDIKLKRYFPLLVCALLAVVAYLQASGIGKLVASSMAEPPKVASVHGGPKRVSLASNRKRVSGKPILARNPFDSVAGPLDGTAVDLGDAGAAPIAAGPDDSGDPLEDPTCEVGRVLFISTADDPEWSFAAIESTGGKPLLRRKGDEVEGHTVQFLAWDRVWLSGTAGRCQLKLGERAEKQPKRPKARKPRSGRKRGRSLDPELAAKIHQVSDTQFNVDRSVVDEILQNQAQLMRSARIVPEREGDKVVGIRLFGIRKGTLLSHLGLQNGDRLHTINGFEITDPQKALEAYGRLRTADQLKVSITRKGKPMTIDFNIQ